MGEWKRARLGDHIRTRKGYAFKSKWYSTKGVPIVKVSDFTEDSVRVSKLTRIPVEIAEQYNRYSLKKDDVIIQTVGSWPTNPKSVVGKTIKVPSGIDGALLNQNAVKIVPTSDLDNKYLFYLLRSNDFKNYIIGCAQGAANQASITLDSIKDYEFLLPSKNYQGKVAGILSCFDDLIEVNLRKIGVLEEIAKGIYTEWFVYRRYPGHKKAEIIHTPKGPTPKGWKWRKIGNVIKLVYGKALKKADRSPGDFPVYGSSGVVGFHGAYLVEGPVVIVGRKGNVGSVFWSYDNCYPIDTVFYVKTHLPQHYIYFNFQQQNFIDSHAAVPGLSRTQAYGLPILIPNQEVLKHFTEDISLVFDQIHALRQINEKLSQVRDLLLPKLISGRINVTKLDIDTSGD